MKKINRITCKKFVIYAKKNLEQTKKNTIKYRIIVITPANIEALLIIFVT